MGITRAASKAKGRRGVWEVRDLLLKYAPDLKPDDIAIPGGSSPGADLHLSPAAKELYPFAIEVKYQESISIWAAIKQALSHVIDHSGCIPLLFFKRNRSKLMVCMEAEEFIRLIR
jgi:hypothetical protein